MYIFGSSCLFIKYIKYKTIIEPLNCFLELCIRPEAIWWNTILFWLIFHHSEHRSSISCFDTCIETFDRVFIQKPVYECHIAWKIFYYEITIKYDGLSVFVVTFVKHFYSACCVIQIYTLYCVNYLTVLYSAGDFTRNIWLYFQCYFLYNQLNLYYSIVFVNWHLFLMKSDVIVIKIHVMLMTWL